MRVDRPDTIVERNRVFHTEIKDYREQGRADQYAISPQDIDAEAQL
jgi:hypothetical protein